MPILVPSGKQFSLHKLMAMSTMLSPTHGRDPLTQGNGTATSPTHQLYLSHAIQDHLRRVFDTLCNAEATISHDQFAAWLATTQHQSIERLKDSYKFEEFLEALYYNYVFAAMNKKHFGDKDLTKPISHYFISSSHNTYLVGNQLSSKSSTEAYTKVLLAGCRCIEIDVHDGDAVDSKSDDGSQLSKDSSQKSDHKRHISTSTIASEVVNRKEAVDEAIGNAKKKLMEKSPFAKKVLAGDNGKSSETLTVGESIKRPSSAQSMMNGEPLVLHGWTLTAPIGFRAVCKAIRENAFVASTLPIIVSLEVHANLEQQEVMVRIMKEEWGSLLVDEAYDDCDPQARLPRLDELSNRILVKVKRALPQFTPEKLERMRTAPTSDPNALAPITNTSHPDSGQSCSEDEPSSASSNNKKKKTGICENLSKLGIYTHSEHFKNFEAASARNPSHVYSVGEKEILELHQNQKTELFNHNRSYFMRAYPASIRFDSSNLDPSIFWRKGVQMVALNWQHLDEAMMLNEGMFADEFGWVLKPKGYRKDLTEAIEYKVLDLKMTIFAGQHIPIPPGQTEKNFYPFVKCELHVEAHEDRSDDPIEGNGKLPGGGSYKLRTPHRHGDHPDFGPEGHALDFSGIPKVVEELSFVRFKIEDHGFATTDLAAWACIRLDRLQQGYRFVTLFDAKGAATNGLLLVKVVKVLR